MKLVQLKLHIKAKICRRCKRTIHAGEKAWRLSGRRKTTYYCKKCGDEIQL